MARVSGMVMPMPMPMDFGRLRVGGGVVDVVDVDVGDGAAAVDGCLVDDVQKLVMQGNGEVLGIEVGIA